MNRSHHSTGQCPRIAALLLLGLSATGPSAQDRTRTAVPRPSALHLAAAAFLPNGGQWADDVLFAARSRSAQLAVERDGLHLRLAAPDDRAVSLRLRWPQPCRDVAGEGASPGRFSVLTGSDPGRWRSGLTAWGSVRCRGIAPGVDLRVLPDATAFEYDLEIAPHAGVAAIVLCVEGATGIAVEADGRLRIDTAAGPLHQGIPATFAELPDGSRTKVECRFRVLGPDRFGFELGEHAADRPVVIDPVLAWSTYFGGAGGDIVYSVTTMPGSGDLIVAGPTSSAVWPSLPPGGAQGSPGGGASDAFVARLAAGTGALLAFTYLGGSLGDAALDVATDAAGAVYVTGNTSSTDFPTATPVQGGLNGGTDAFLTKLDPMLGSIAWSTWLGGSSSEAGRSVAVTAAGEAVIVGHTSSADFPVVAAAQPVYRGSDAFVARFAASGTSLIHATFLGGSAAEQANAVAIAADGDAVVCGWTASVDFPTYRAFDASHGGSLDGYVARYSPTGATRWASFLGGANVDSAGGVAVHPSGEVFVGGHTSSTDFPIVGMPVQPVFAGPYGSDLFVARIASSGSSITASTYFGGTGIENATDLEVAPGGMVLLSGTTDSIDLPLTRGTFQGVLGGGAADRMLAVIDHGLSALVFGTYFGGADYEAGNGLAAIAGTGAFGMALAGGTDSSDLPVTAGAYSATFGGITDGFVANLAPQDWGDLPDLGAVHGGVARSYLTLESSDGPRYDEVGLQRLGLLADLERDGQPSGAADGDDLAPGGDDEDGVVFSVGGVSITVASWRTGTVPFRIDAWFDVDDDGTFEEATEHLISSTGGGPGAVTISRLSATTTPTLATFTFPVRPAGRDPREFYSRFRLTWDVPPTTPILHFGEFAAASDGNSHGEVEDHAPGLPSAPCHQLTAPFDATANLPVGGMLYFDLDAQVPVTIQGLELALAGSSVGEIEVYTCAGGRAGRQLLSSAWTLVSRGAAAPAGANVPSTVALTPFQLQPGVTGIALRSIGLAHRYRSGNATYATPELAWIAGEATSTPFAGGLLGSRIAGCRICYTAAGTPWAVRERFGSGCPASGASTFYELFPPGAFDLGTPTNASVRSIHMTLDGRGYRLAPGSNAWHVPVTQDLGLGDDWVSPPQALPWTFPYPLGTTTEVRVGSNGVVWPTAQSDTDYTPSVPELLNGAPRFCPFWTDLDPTNVGTVTAEVVPGAAAFAVTWSGVPLFGVAASSVTAQILFFANGDLELRWKACSTQGRVMVGWTRGGGSADTGNIDLSALPAAGHATGQDGTPLRLDARNRPVLGSTCLLETSGIPGNALFAGVLLGLQVHDPGIELSAFGMPGCRQYTVGIASYALTLPGPIAVLPLTIPAAPGLLGLPLGAQSVAHGPGQNAAGLIASNGLRLTVGN